MLGLLLKDFYNVRKQAAWYAAMIVLFCVISVALGNTAFASTIGILVTVSIPITAIAYEEKDGWQKFVVAGGMGAKAIVGEKFLLGILCALVSSVGYSIVFAMTGDHSNAVVEVVVPICMQFIALAEVLPLVFKFGVEKGRTYMIALIVALMAAFLALMPALADGLSGGGTVPAVCEACVNVTLLVLSYIVSVIVYGKKEF